MSLNDVRLNDIHMTGMDAVLKMSGGNPGAMSACVQLLEHGKAIDPMAFAGGLSNLLDLDTLHIYDDRIYLLWNDVCGRDVGKMIAVLRAYQLGQLAGVTKEALNYAIDHRGKGLDLGKIVAAVKENLPEFNPEARAPDIVRRPNHPLFNRDDKDDKRDKYEAVKV